MIRLAASLAVLALLGAALALVLVGVLGRPLDIWVLFLLQAMTIAAAAISFRQVRKRGVTDFITSVPRWAKFTLPVVAAAGVALTAGDLISAMPRVSPSGQAVFSYSANAESGECRVIYNKTEHAVEPIQTCLTFERSASLAFIGAWLLFGSIALWLALLASKAPHADHEMY